MTQAKYAPCPCDSKEPYQKCCRPFHQGEAPPVAEKLMRSRYAAYALGLVDYIMDTTDRQNKSFNEDRPAWRLDLQAFCSQTKFDGLKILASENGEELSTVTFRAYLRQGNADASFSEKSIFVKANGRWFYQSGEIS